MKTRANKLYLKVEDLRCYLDAPDEVLLCLVRRRVFPIVYCDGIAYIPKSAFFAWLNFSTLGGAA